MSAAGHPAQLVVLFNRLGPYHHARLQAAGRLGAVATIELEPESTTYAWDTIRECGTYQRDRIEREEQSPLKVLASKLEKFDPAGVAICGYAEPLALWALAWCVRKRVPSILMSESTRDDALRTPAIEVMKSYVVRRFGAALVGGRRQRAYAVELGLPEGSIRQGYDAVDNAFFAERCAQLRANPPPDFPLAAANYFLASCRFIAKKNIATLIEALRRCKSMGQLRDWKLVLLGDGPQWAVIDTQIREAGLANDVVLPGFVQYDELPRYYAFAKFFVHASSVEQWGLVVNEAMACSLPVIVSRQSGCSPDLVDEGRNGFTFDAWDPAALASLLHRVANQDLETSRTMGIRSREIIHGFSCDVFAQNLWAALDCAKQAPPVAIPSISSATLEMLARALRVQAAP